MRWITVLPLLVASVTAKDGDATSPQCDACPQDVKPLGSYARARRFCLSECPSLCVGASTTTTVTTTVTPAPLVLSTTAYVPVNPSPYTLTRANTTIVLTANRTAIETLRRNSTAVTTATSTITLVSTVLQTSTVTSDVTVTRQNDATVSTPVSTDLVTRPATTVYLTETSTITSVPVLSVFRRSTEEEEEHLDYLFRLFQAQSPSFIKLGCSCLEKDNNWTGSCRKGALSTVTVTKTETASQPTTTKTITAITTGSVTSTVTPDPLRVTKTTFVTLTQTVTLVVKTTKSITVTATSTSSTTDLSSITVTDLHTDEVTSTHTVPFTTTQTVLSGTETHYPCVDGPLEHYGTTYQCGYDVHCAQEFARIQAPVSYEVSNKDTAQECMLSCANDSDCLALEYQYSTHECTWYEYDFFTDPMSQPVEYSTNYDKVAMVWQGAGSCGPVQHP